jgi:hypothetical protein
MTSHAPLIADLGESVLALVDALNEAAAVQWEVPPRPLPAEDTTERSKGTISNPTLAIATDPRRLRVRAEVIAAEADIAKLAAAARARAEALTAATDTYRE